MAIGNKFPQHQSFQPNCNPPCLQKLSFLLQLFLPSLIIPKADAAETTPKVIPTTIAPATFTPGVANTTVPAMAPTPKPNPPTPTTTSPPERLVDVYKGEISGFRLLKALNAELYLSPKKTHPCFHNKKRCKENKTPHFPRHPLYYPKN